jgi:hypothetical protein
VTYIELRRNSLDLILKDNLHGVAHLVKSWAAYPIRNRNRKIPDLPKVLETLPQSVQSLIPSMPAGGWAQKNQSLAWENFRFGQN